MSSRRRFAAGTLSISAIDLALMPTGVDADLTGIALPNGSGGALSPQVDALHVTAVTTRPFPNAPTPDASARAWRDAGGRVALGPASLRWGPLAALGQGSVGLDDQLQPDAAGTVDASGLPDLLDALARSGAVPGPAASAAKAVLAVLSAPSGGKSVHLPVVLSRGILSVARYPLLRVPPLAWP